MQPLVTRSWSHEVTGSSATPLLLLNSSLDLTSAEAAATHSATLTA
jgi:hypothetical protein